MEDIKAKLAGSTIFTKLDFKSVFHQLTLAPESQYVTVFHGKGCLMRYKKLTMGNLVASGELNKVLQPLFSNIKYVHLIHDGLIGATPDTLHHEKALEEVLTSAIKAGLTLNPEKCAFAATEIPFWGVKVSKEGIKPDPAKVEFVQNAEPPTTKDEVTSFLSIIQSNAEFIANLSSLNSNLRALTEKHKKFHWTKTYQQEFDHIKAVFCKDTINRFFDPNQPTYLLVDAHYTGLGAILAQGPSIQKCLQVAIASCATSKIEKQYPQLDLEGLAVDFGLQRF